MGTYVASARTNYFRVRDRAAFTEDLDRFFPNWGHNVVDGDDNDPQGSLAVLDTDGFGWPTCEYDEYDEVEGALDEVSLLDIIQRHLVDGDVAVLQECGHEKARYVTGVAVAVNSTGDIVMVSLDDVYEKAKTLGATITAAAY